MKTLKKFFLFYFLNCVSQVDNSDCIYYGDGLLDGFLYKEVILTDIHKLNNIAIDAEIVKSCCCNLFK